jgi:ribosomal protein S18 acetylase RimI-like enzyme
MSDLQKCTQIKSLPYSTNCFMVEQDIFDTEEKCKYKTVHREGLFGFFKNSNYHFKHLNFYLNENKLSESKKINWNEDFFVTEIITTNEDSVQSQSLKNWLVTQSNYHYHAFFRMLRTDKTKFNLDYSKVQHPSEEDFQPIIFYLEKTFDIFTERIPNIERLKQIRASCFIIKENNQIAAILITEIKGKNQELFFMVTLPEFEGKGYGSVLMTYVFNNPEIQRWVMWVDASNERVIDWYYKIGYKKDKLINNIYINKNIMNEKILKILRDTRDEFDFADATVNFTEAGYLDSFDIISIVVDLETAFDVKISGALIIPENFKNLDAIANLIQLSKDVSKV